MKKNKIFGVLMAAALTLGMTVPSFAADPATITIEGSGAAYSAYRLLNLTTSLKSGCGHTDAAAHVDTCYNYSYTVNEGYRSALQSVVPDADSDGTVSDAEIIAYIGGLGDNSDAIRTFADTIYGKIKSMSADAETTNKIFSNVPQGYYMIAETEADTGTDAVSLVMLDTNGQRGITVTSKEDVPELTKQVQETSDAGPGEYGKAADADIGDHVPFRLVGTMPSNIANFDKYVYAFHDNLDASLSLDKDSVKVYIQNGDSKTEVTSGWELKDSSLSDECDFEIYFGDIKNGNTIDANTQVIVEYTATLKTDAPLQSNNTAHLEFTQSPYATGEGDATSNTPDDSAVVFTYTLVVDKTDKVTNQPLPGAHFKVMKWDQNSNDYIDYTNGTIEENLTATKFTFKGLDAGKYKLVETKVPDGYNAIEDIEFTVTSAFTDKELTTFTVDPSDSFTATLETGSISTIVPNETGSILPTTGGSGTYVLYGAGALLLAGGIAFVITRRKKSTKTEG